MEMPGIKTTVKDPRSGVVYDVMAYRKLTPEEAVEAVWVKLSQMKKSKRPKRGEKLTIYTVID